MGGNNVSSSNAKAQSMPNRMWPFGITSAIVAVPIIILLAFLFFAVLRAVAGWPDKEADMAVVIGALILGLLPPILVAIDRLIDRGAVLEFQGLKLDLSRVADVAAPSPVTVPNNIGAYGGTVSDSGSFAIIQALEGAAGHDVVIVDLEKGDAWWETRLLVLVAGAARRSRPKAIVFLGTIETRSGCFLGWAPPETLLTQLLGSLGQYRQIYAAVESADHLWSLLDPKRPNLPPWSPIDSVANRYFYFAFENNQPKPHRFEQALASELEKEVENHAGPRQISAARLDELFLPVLHKITIDDTKTQAEQLESLFSGEEPFIAVTHAKQYLRLLPRAAAINALLRDLVRNKLADSKKE